MQGKVKERWEMLCEQAANERNDPSGPCRLRFSLYAVTMQMN